MTPRGIPLAVIALAVGGFGIGLTEFAIVGLLPEIGAEFRVDEAAAGWLVSGYALSVAGGGLALTAAASRIERKYALLALVVLFVVGNLLSAIAGDYGLMLAGRIVAALCHGAFFGIGAVLAAELAGPERGGRAISVMFGGLTLANVLGVPFGTVIGQAFGWRSVFATIVVVGVATFLAILAWVPRSDHHEPPQLRRELAALIRPTVLGSLAITVLGFGGMFGAFTYIAYTLTGVSGFAETAIPLLLLLFGVGLVAGNAVGGRAADRSIDGTLAIGLALLTVVLVGFALVAAWPAGAVVGLGLMGFFGFAIVPGLQSRVLAHSGGASTLASGANIAAFNLGNGLGAWIGGLTIAAGWGYVSTLWDAAGMTIAALVVLAVSALLGRRATRRQPVTG